MSHKRIVIAVAVLIVLIAAFELKNCRRQRRAPNRGLIEQSTDFAPVDTIGLRLEVVSSKTDYLRGDPDPTMTFRLKNTGLGPVCIREWMANERDNVRLLYAECPSGNPSDIAPGDWKAWNPKLPSPIPRFPLDLCPNNSALIDARLGFLGEPCITNHKAGRYAVYGELNLKSAQLKSAPLVIKVR